MAEETHPPATPDLAGYIEDMLDELAQLARAGRLPELAAMLTITGIEAGRRRAASAAADQPAGQQFRAAS